VEQQYPEVLAMVLADEIHKDMVTEKLFVLGTFSVFTVEKVPSTHNFAVYAAITNGHGKTAIRLRLVDVDESQVPIIDEDLLTVDFTDPILVIEVVFPLPNITFPEYGEYRLQLYGAGQFLRERRLHVLPRQPYSNGGHPDEST
jgi:hypothetical protein